MSAPHSSGWDGVERRVGPRRVRRRYRFIERRHGFDRRKRYPVLGTMRDHPWLVAVVLVALNALSLADGYFTVAELVLGLASEGNPVLAAANRQGPLVAIATKMGAMLVVSVVIWQGRKRRSILGLSLVALVLFGALVAYHWHTLTALGVL